MDLTICDRYGRPVGSVAIAARPIDEPGPAPFADVRAVESRIAEARAVRVKAAPGTPSIGQMIARQTQMMDAAMLNRMFSRYFRTA